MFNFKRKEKFDKASVLGLAFSTIAAGCMAYEILFSENPRVFLLIMYTVVIAIGGVYIFLIED